MGLRFLHPGLSTTVQDEGRPGSRDRGIPTGGAFDRWSHRLANTLVGNDPSASTLEMTLWGGMAEATAPMRLGLAGAIGVVSVERSGREGLVVRTPAVWSVDSGDRVEFTAFDRGARGYLAVAGGWQAPRMLGSRSTDRPLSKGEVVESAWSEAARPRPTHRLLDPCWMRTLLPERPIRVVPGPDGGDARGWLDREWRVGALADRMGIRLEAEGFEMAVDLERLSAPTVIGGLQATGRSLIALGPDSGTMGGYPMVGVVIDVDRDRLGQLRPGEGVRFQPVGVAEAREIGRVERSIETQLLFGLAARLGVEPGGMHP